MEAEEEGSLGVGGGAETEWADVVTAALVVVAAAAISSGTPPPPTPSPVVGGLTPTKPPATSPTRPGPGHPPLEVAGGRMILAAMSVMPVVAVADVGADVLSMMGLTAGVMSALMMGMMLTVAAAIGVLTLTGVVVIAVPLVAPMGG